MNKVQKILITIVAAFTIIGSVFGMMTWFYNRAGVQTAMKANADQVPEIIKANAAHREEDHVIHQELRDAIVSSREENKALKEEIQGLREDIKENTRARQWDRFNSRK